MKKITLIIIALAPVLLLAQANKDKAVFKEYKPGYYKNTILKGISDYDEKQDTKPKTRRRFKIDLTDKTYPIDPDLYKKQWHNEVISQGNTGTCWCFSTTSFYESEVFRITGKKVKLSEMYPVYWEYVERAKYFVENRGKMYFGEGSETNAVARMYAKYGTVPLTDFTGLKKDQKVHTHAKMFEELDKYLKSVKERSAWNMEEVVATTKSILNHHMGTPPEKITVDGKTMTPVEYKDKVLKLKMDEYVDFMSLMAKPYWQQAEYKVPDNWWKSDVYHNVPLDNFISALKGAIDNGYTISIGGDVSEAGFETSKQVAVIPSFDIPSEYIDESARQFRFSNKSTTDDHAMHLVGHYEKDGDNWFLIKDSGSGSRNCGKDCKAFGYYFFHEDYIKLKMMSFTVHKNAVKETLKNFNKL